jgi:cytochrome c-type biogenesis protein CcmH
MIPPALIAALALLAVVALAVVLFPLLRRARAAESDARYDRAVYRDQLQEVERDVARGLLGSDEAASARLEIERRLLATGDDPDAASPTARAERRVLLAGMVAALALTWAAGAYMILGRPEAPDMPFAARQDEDQIPQMPTDVEGAAARLEAKLEADGGDADGWMLLARTESALRHWDKAANAYHRLLGFAPDEAKPGIEEIYGEMLVLAAGGIVSPDASAAFAVTLAAKPDSQVARYYVALSDAQAGNARRAIDSWVKLAGELPADSTMRDEIARRVADLSKSAGLAPPTLPPPAALSPAPPKP